MDPVAIVTAMIVMISAAGVRASAQEIALPTGVLVPSVSVLSAPGESYALYLPNAYTPARRWPIILAFDPGARGQTAVERYRLAAGQYGYIIAGSNTSRNYQNNDSAVTAMAGDVLSRVSVDPDRRKSHGSSTMILPVRMSISAPDVRRHG